MELITKHYDKRHNINELMKSKAYKSLETKMDSAFKSECHNLTPKTVTQLQNLISHELTSEACMLLLRPIVRAKQLSKVIRDANTQEEKKKKITLIRFAQSVKKDLEKSSCDLELIQLLKKNKELDREKLTALLNEYIELQKEACEPSFQNGEPLNQHNLKRFGIHCLFHIGKKIELSKEGKPSPLFKFVHIATDLEYKAIGEIYSTYNEDTLIEELNANKILQFIYNPTLDPSARNPFSKQNQSSSFT